MNRHLIVGASTLASLSTVVGACGAGDHAPAASIPAAARASASPAPTGAAPTSAAAAEEGGPSFACRGPLASCFAEACPNEQTCLGDGNVACGAAPTLGKPCPTGTCELAGAELGARVCLPDGCCAARTPVPAAPGCDDVAPSALIEVERGGTRESWLACLDSSTGRQVNELLFRDGTRLVFTFSGAYAEVVGEAQSIRGFLLPPRGRLGGALVALGEGATAVRNPYDQQRIVAPRARVVRREPSEPVEGAVVFGERDRRGRVEEFGKIGGEPLPADGLHTSTCGTDQEGTFVCSALIGADAAPTWLFVELDAERKLLDAIVAWSRPTGADVFVASRATVDEKGRVDLTDLRRVGRADDADGGGAVVRVTMDN